MAFQRTMPTAILLQSAVDFAGQRVIDFGELFVADGVGGQVEQFMAEDFRLARPCGGLRPKALDLRPNGADMPAERFPVLALVARIGPTAGDAGGRNVLVLEDRFGLSGIGDAEQDGVGRAEPFLVIALAQGTNR